MNWTLAITLTLTSAALVACVSRGDPPVAARPNILVILADDLGYSDIGAFGGEISTPHIDALVASGRVLTHYRTGATCSPTRAMLMSGTDHHIAGLGGMGEVIGSAIANNTAPWGAAHRYGLASLPDGYEGYLNERVLWMPQLMADAGYYTVMAGKWHLAMKPAAQGTRGPSPFVLHPDAYPNRRGFERSFALLQGGGSHFAPVPGKPIAADLAANHVEDDVAVQLPPDFYSTRNYTDKLIGYLEAGKGDGRPFFAYLAYTAPHWPLHALDADIAKYKGRYDEGYEVIRARRVARQKALGLVPADFNPNAGLDASFGRPVWASLSPEQRAFEARKMEVYAAMVDHMDQQIGRLIQYLKDTGRYENTLIVFTSDNGAEGAPNFFPDNANTDNSLANIGRPLSNLTYGERWAEVSATPFRLWKGMPTEGGVTAPMAVRLPGQRAALPALKDAAHVSDLLPTFMEAAGIANPGTQYAGRTVQPMTGVSMLARLQGRSDEAIRGPNDALAGELFTGRYVVRGPWKLVSVQAPFGDNRWQLFNLATDRGENHNVIDAHPAVAAQLIAEYEAYAARTGVVHLPGSRGRAPAP